MLKTALESVLETALEAAFKTLLKQNLKKVRIAGELTVTIYLQFVRKIQQQDTTLRHFFLSVTITLQFHAAYTGGASPNAI
ncbi:MAG TPA: hypothetical protein DEO68_11380 [Halomonas campaniensis]|uniref:Uncharacterized protein n=1 Tax=Halomonas campaniensis TaxID=213554 RepID=A0A3D0KHU8_9GAMM|nr:hypothetical protein [Halomonas campaniensis]HCA02759.1 hypothetical protein [Halomonas campaniensis]